MTPLDGVPRLGSGLSLHLEVLGRTSALATLSLPDGGRRETIRLSPRHSEILLLLASTSRGLSGDELAVLVYEDDSSASTLRAELNRLRGLLGDELLASRPYRLVAELTGDWLGVEASLAAEPCGRRCGSTAARCCRGRRLPASCGCATGSRPSCAGPSSRAARPT